MVSDGDDLSTPGLARRLAQALGVPSRLLPMPVALLSLAGAMTGKSAAVDRLVGSLQLDTSAIRAHAGMDAAVRRGPGLAGDSALVPSGSRGAGLRGGYNTGRMQATLAGPILAPALAFALSFALLRLLLSPSAQRWFLDHPNQRSLHASPIPRTGGLAIVPAAVLGLLLAGGARLPARARGGVDAAVGAGRLASSACTRAAPRTPGSGPGLRAACAARAGDRVVAPACDCSGLDDQPVQFHGWSGRTGRRHGAHRVFRLWVVRLAVRSTRIRAGQLLRRRCCRRLSDLQLPPGQHLHGRCRLDSARVSRRRAWA